MNQSQAPELTTKHTHGEDSDGNFLLADYINTSTGQFCQKKVYFSKPEQEPDYKSFGFTHWQQPRDYYVRNQHEVGYNEQPPAGPELPSGVEYSELNPEQKAMIPHRIGARGRRASQELFDKLNTAMDTNWLSECLKIHIVEMLMSGTTGMYFYAKVKVNEIQNPKSKDTKEFIDDQKRLAAAPDHPRESGKFVIVKEYVTAEMSKPEQMERVYEETLAHIQLNKHPNIVDTFAVRFRLASAKDADDNEVINGLNPKTDIRCFILMEFSWHGSWSIFMKKLQNEKIDWQSNSGYLYLHLQDAIRGLDHLHSTGRAHRDWSYSNCLAVHQSQDRLKQSDNPGTVNCVIKICDFAFTKRFGDKDLLKSWQSMDVMDFGRMILWLVKEYLGQCEETLKKDLKDLAEFLMGDGVDKRIGNFKKLVMKSDESQNAEEYFKKAMSK